MRVILGMPYIPNLAAIRLRCGLSQAALARKANVDRATVSRCENGYFVMDIKSAAIESAMRLEAEKRGVPISDMTVKSGGNIGEFPKKKKKKIEVQENNAQQAGKIRNSSDG
jgi:transcriptional regulator with XRE-family HTH domain